MNLTKGGEFHVEDVDEKNRLKSGAEGLWIAEEFETPGDRAIEAFWEGKWKSYFKELNLAQVITRSGTNEKRPWVSESKPRRFHQVWKGVLKNTLPFSCGMQLLEAGGGGRGRLWHLPKRDGKAMHLQREKPGPPLLRTMGPWRKLFLHWESSLSGEGPYEDHPREQELLAPISE